MNEAIIGTVAGYLVLVILLLNLGLYTKWPVWIKTAAICLVAIFYFVTYHSIKQFLGWPTEKALPEKFMMLSSWITEPDKKTGNGGSIHLWAVELSDDGPADEPRAYALAYDADLHHKLNEAHHRLRQGMIQIGSATKPEQDFGWVTRKKFAENKQKINFYDLPDPELPEK